MKCPPPPPPPQKFCVVYLNLSDEGINSDLIYILINEINH